ncbi:Glutathione S-transferase [Quillaja saponaria]|uniref:Glutathione S-transferase n=1 Tax=Quillaja saponaria TaxID=32244 RepID=A0AAD7PMA8_QUISA|nr:Glutathione S-transferase [Quillaja saponaria]
MQLYSIRKKIWAVKGKEQEEAKKQFMEGLKTLEGEIGEKAYFGVEEFGFVDSALVPITFWFYTYDTCGSLSIGTECPKLVEWAKRCMEKVSVSMLLPHPRKIYDFVLHFRKTHGLE